MYRPLTDEQLALESPRLRSDREREIGAFAVGMVTFGTMQLPGVAPEYAQPVLQLDAIAAEPGFLPPAAIGVAPLPAALRMDRLGQRALAIQAMARNYGALALAS